MVVDLNTHITRDLRLTLLVQAVPSRSSTPRERPLYRRARSSICRCHSCYRTATSCQYQRSPLRTPPLAQHLLPKTVSASAPVAGHGLGWSDHKKYRGDIFLRKAASIDEEQCVEAELGEGNDDSSSSDETVIKCSDNFTDQNGSEANRKSSTGGCNDIARISGGADTFSINNKQLLALGEFSASDMSSSGIISSPQDLAAKLKVDPSSGLSGAKEDCARREEAFGANRLAARQDVSFAQLLLEALNDVTVLVLLGAGVLSLTLALTLDEGSQSWIEGAAIMAAVGVVVLVTAVNNFQKEAQFRELNKISEDILVRVLRCGSECSISTYDLLVGDVLIVGMGDILAADGILLQGSDLRLDESHMTGEAKEVGKSPQVAPFLFGGSKVLEGCGRMLVTAVGSNSQQGIISGMVAGVGADTGGLRQTTQLQRKLDTMARQIGQFGLLAAVVSLLGMAAPFSYETFVVEGKPWSVELLEHYLHFLIQSITILVVAVPEGLPLAVTIALAFSVKRMLADNNLVRNLAAAETMGCATTICTDKTGTLTCNDMAAVRLWIGGRDHYALQDLCYRPRPAADPLDLSTGLLQLLTEGVSLNSSANLESSPEMSGGILKVGSRTECALLILSESLGASYAQLRSDWEPRMLRVISFSSERKMMSTLVAHSQQSDESVTNARLHVKGAGEIVLDHCTHVLTSDGSQKELSHVEKSELLKSLSTNGLRIVAIAYRNVTLPSLSDEEAIAAMDSLHLERNLTLVGLVGIEDPIRREVPAAIRSCQRAGISVRMLTGDNATTGSAIARQAGILPAGAHIYHPKGQEELRALLNSFEAPLQNAHVTGDATAPYASTSSDDASTAVGITEGLLVLDGPDFRRAVLDADGQLQQGVFDSIWPRLRVLARCSPADKYTIVKGLQANPNEVVAMTGDGTNDAPALRLADVGFAMDIGTSIAKDASDILLMDNNFSSIVSAVKWGRNVYIGVTRFLQFQLTINVVAIVTACAGSLFLQESPLTAVQMLWVNLIMDSLASLALATDAPTDAVLDLPPYRSDRPLITKTLWRNIVGQAIFQLTVMYTLVMHGDTIFGVPSHSALEGLPSQHFTIVFNAFVIMQLFNQVNSRKIDDEGDVLEGVFSNKLFVGILAAEITLQVVIVQYGGEAFMTQPLDWQQWGACVGIGALGLLVRAGLRLLRV